MPPGVKLLLLTALATLGCNSALPRGLATACAAPPDALPRAYALAAATAPGTTAGAADLLARFAPAFVVEEGAAEWNRIGTPTLERRGGGERARVDPNHATLYGEVHELRVGSRAVWQLVYRVHFEQLAFTPRTFASLHRNAGLLVLVCVDQESGLPLTLTTVQSCGCWAAVVPTTALAREALPADWPEGSLELGGEFLPASLPVPAEGQRFVVHLRSRTHRVHALEVGVPGPSDFRLAFEGMDELYRLPIRGAPGERGSFFYEAGYLQGYVKGAWVPLEGLTLGLLTLDPRLGMDRDFGDPAEVGARFFTALTPWKRERSRLDRFGRALEQLGFRTQAFAPRGAD